MHQYSIFQHHLRLTLTSQHLDQPWRNTIHPKTTSRTTTASYQIFIQGCLPCQLCQFTSCGENHLDSIGLEAELVLCGGITLVSLEGRNELWTGCGYYSMGMGMNRNRNMIVIVNMDVAESCIIGSIVAAVLLLVHYLGYRGCGRSRNVNDSQKYPPCTSSKNVGESCPRLKRQPSRFYLHNILFD